MVIQFDGISIYFEEIDKKYKLRLESVSEDHVTVWIPAEAYDYVHMDMVCELMEYTQGVYVYKGKLISIQNKGENENKDLLAKIELGEFIEQIQRRRDIKEKTCIRGEIYGKFSSRHDGIKRDIEVMDLSAGGLCFATDVELDIDSIVLTKFDLEQKNGKSESIAVSSKILRKNKLEEKQSMEVAERLDMDKMTPIYSYGCCFDNLLEKDETKIRGYVFAKNAERARYKKQKEIEGNM